MKQGLWQWLKRLLTLIEIPAPDPPRLLHRIEIMERDIMLPLKAVAILIIFYSFISTPRFGLVLSTLEIAVETVQSIFILYVLTNALFALLLMNIMRLPLAIVQWTVVTSGLVDGLLVAGMMLLTGGSDSILFWLFVPLIVRNAVSVPTGFSQLFLDFAISLCYILVSVLGIFISSNLDDFARHSLSQILGENLGQPFILRLAVLWLMALCCYGAQVLLDRQRLATEEAEESATRTGQLRSAGRLAAEFAHQIKNPLAIINNAAFSLQRTLNNGKTDVAQQIEIIQEEVSRADQIITQIMGYAKLTEGRVEKLDVVQELNLAITQVFPPAVPTDICIHCEYGRTFPPLFIQRRHLSEIFVNLLKNAGEALDGKGNIFVAADCRRNNLIEISIRDDGPGIPPDKIQRIFEAYYTTKKGGTGLGLAIVRHNVELYGGTLRVKSELGKGAKFTIVFPVKTFAEPAG
jgi:signal transduction histidine kinase